MVIDNNGSMRDDIAIIFSEIARVKEHGASLGAVRFIREWIDAANLIIMEVFLGDGTCFDVLERMKGDEALSKIPVIVVSTSKEDEPIIKRELSSYPQVKFVIYKHELMKKLISLSSLLEKK